MHLRLFTLAWLVAPLGAQVPADYVDEEVAAPFSGAVGTLALEDDAWLVWERRGQVWSVQEGEAPELLLDISEEVGRWRDHGLLGVAVDPAFEDGSGFLYLAYVVDRHHLLHFGTGGYDPGTDEYFDATIGRVTRYAVIEGAVDLGSRLILLGEDITSGVPITYETHGIGTLAFGPDGALWLSTGDGATFTSVDAGSNPGTYYAQALTDGILRSEENVGAFRSQMVGSLCGKLLRFDPETGDGLPDNPFYDKVSPRSAQSRVWALGLRNPFRFAIDEDGHVAIGDVGWSAKEEWNLATERGLNFGWPLFEGLDTNTVYVAATTANLDAPNPAFGGSCTQSHFDFQELLLADDPEHDTIALNSCDGSPIPAPTFHHTRPAIDWNHGPDEARVPTFTGQAPSHEVLGTPQSPVLGDSFAGGCSVAGAWMNDPLFGDFRDLYLHADFTGGWVRALRFDGTTLLEVAPFGDLGPVTDFAARGDALYYVPYASGPNEGSLRRVRYDGNAAPVAVATVDDELRLDGSSSFDPEGQPLTFLWDLGALGTSTVPSPLIPFPPGVHPITLTVTDPGGASAQTSLTVHAGNTAPTAAITGDPSGAHFNAASPGLISLIAQGTDAEDGTPTWTWRLRRLHGGHAHELGTSVGPTLDFTPPTVHQDGAFTAIEVELEASDSGGLTTITRWYAYPDFGGATPNWNAPTTAPPQGTATAVVFGTASRVELYLNGERIATSVSVPHVIHFPAPEPGEHHLVARADDAYTPGVLLTVPTPTEVRATVDRVRDDANEEPGALRRGAARLDLGWAGTLPTITGVRVALDVPAGATIVSAHLQVTAAQPGTGLAAVSLTAEDTGDAPKISATPGTLRGRTRIPAAVTWSIDDWLESGARGEAQRSPDLASILQHLVDRPDWKSGNHMLLLLEGAGKRSAHAFQTGSTEAPTLVVEYLP